LAQYRNGCADWQELLWLQFLLYPVQSVEDFPERMFDASQGIFDFDLV
jgi:hypothetical protein